MSSTNEHQKNVSHLAMISLSQLGVITQFAKQISAINNFEELNSLLLSAIQQLDVESVYRLNCYGYLRTEFTSNGLNKCFYKKLCGIAKIKNKITWLEDACILSSPNFLIALKNTKKDKNQFHTLIDNMTIMFDIIDNWICAHIKKTDFYLSFHSKRKEVLARISIALDKNMSSADMAFKTHQQIAEQTKLNLISKFPFLSMEADQEDSILDIIDEASRKGLDVLQNRTFIEHELSTLLTEAVDILSSHSYDIDSKPRENMNERINIDESITLF